MDTPQPNRRLSEISHLFLSSVRQRQTGGAPTPQRKAPLARPDVSIDLTPEEFALMLGEERTTPSSPIPPVTALIAAHLNGKQLDQARRYARCLALGGQRIGLIYIDASEFRLLAFDLNQEAASPPGSAETECFDLRAMGEAINEMSCDVDRWLLLVGSTRLPEARAILRNTSRWVLLTTCDPDGVVGAYRTLKGLAPVHQPPVSLAILDAGDAGQAERVVHKLAGVGRQFLNWTIEAGEVVRDAHEVAEHVIMSCCPVKDKAQMASAVHWQVIMDFLTRAGSQPAQRPTPAAAPVASEEIQRVVEVAEPKPVVVEAKPAAQTLKDEEVGTPAVALAPVAAMTGARDSVPEVVDLPANAADEEAILSAVLKAAGSELAECSIRPPMFGEARIAVSRDRRLILLAVQKEGMDSLRGVAQSLRWLTENRQLVTMALPQFSIDAHQLPHLRLLVDQSHFNAELLGSILQSGSVTVQTYRRVRWAGKLGLLLEAA